jgi:tRNA uracil 4-sulfurtransferase
MDERIYLIRFGELSLKGENRGFFEKLLRKNIKRKLQPWPCTVTIQRGRFFLECPEAPDDLIKEVLSTTFGIVGFTRAWKCKKTIESIRSAALSVAREEVEIHGTSSFKINSRRADKSFPLSSYEISCDAGDLICSTFDTVHVDVKKPDWSIGIEVREAAYVYGRMESGPGGLPVGCACRGVVMLSGGIDSPVAAYLMAKRGIKLDAIYFHAYPYTSDEALDKVKQLAAILAPFCGGMRLHVIPFTEAQIAMKKGRRSEEMTLHMRAAMVETSVMLAEEIGAKALVTGEALSQVASQTIESITFTGSFSSLPVLRPLIGLDKQEIITVSQKIGTYETSILPFEDCCTIFSPKHPLVHPDKEKLTLTYRKLMLDEELKKAFQEREIINLPPHTF